MNIFFVNRYFHPDHSATSQLLTDIAIYLARANSVHVITSRQRYDDATARLVPWEIVRGVQVHRVWTSLHGRGSMPGRIVDYFTFYFVAAWRLWRLARKGDVIVAEADPPLISVPAAVVGWLRRAHLVNWLQDLYPEVAQVLDMGGLGRTRGRLATWLRNWSLQRARYNVVLGELMRGRLLALGVASERVRVIANWSDGNWVKPVAADHNALRKEWGLDGEFVVGYSGNLGRVHEIETVLDAAKRLAHRTDIRFVWVGGGAKRRQLQAEAERLGIKSFVYQPYQPRTRLAETLSVADVHLISLIPEMEGLIVPSKFYGVAAAGRPSLLVGAADGEIGRLLHEGACGLSVRPGDGEGLATAIEDLADNPERCRTMGANARALFEARFDKKHAMAAWEDVLAAAVR